MEKIVVAAWATWMFAGIAVMGVGDFMLDRPRVVNAGLWMMGTGAFAFFVSIMLGLWMWAI